MKGWTAHGSVAEDWEYRHLWFRWFVFIVGGCVLLLMLMHAACKTP